MINYSKKFKHFTDYPFKKIYEECDKLASKNIKIIDFATGDPIAHPPSKAITKCIKSLKQNRSDRYPNPTGDPEFIKKVIIYLKKYWSIEVSEDNICSSNGVKEAIFSFVMAFTNHGDYCLVPTPAYPIYRSATLWAGAKPCYLPLLKENDYLPDFKKAPKDIIKKAKIIFINYPNNPTGKIPPDSFFRELVDWAKKNDIIIAHDEVYKDFTKNKHAKSIRNFTDKKTISFYSTSKIYAMQGWRTGFVVGDKEMMKYYKKYKIFTDSGTPTFIQDTTTSILLDPKQKLRLRERFRKCKEEIIDAFKKLGWETENTESTFYVWQKIPKKFMGDEWIMQRFLKDDLATIVLPGSWITETIDGANFGKKYIRIACISSLEDTKLFVKRILKAKELYV